MPKILVLHPSGHVFNVPCVVMLTRALAQWTGASITFLALQNPHAPEGSFDHPSVVTVRIPIKQRRRWADGVGFLLIYLLYSIKESIALRPDVFVCFGLRGLLVGRVLSLLSGRPFIFYSLEFYPNDRRTLARQVLSWVERTCARKADCIVFHDRLRRRVYRKLMKLNIVRALDFPNAPITSVLAAPVPLSRLKKCKSEKKILLLAGGLHSADQLGNLIRAFSKLDAKWTLLLQSHDGVARILHDELVLEMLGARRLIINQTPLPPEQYFVLVRLARIGLAYYSPRSLNMKYVGLSSGKIGGYLSAGVPVLVNKLPYYERTLKKFRAGASYDAIEEIPALVTEIDEYYTEYAQGAQALYESKFALERYKTGFIDYFRDLQSRQS